MVSLDEYYYEVPNINILRNVIEAHAEDYPMYQGDKVPWSQWLTLSAVCASNYKALAKNCVQLWLLVHLDD